MTKDPYRNRRDYKYTATVSGDHKVKRIEFESSDAPVTKCVQRRLALLNKGAPPVPAAPTRDAVAPTKKPKGLPLLNQLLKRKRTAGPIARVNISKTEPHLDDDAPVEVAKNDCRTKAQELVAQAEKFYAKGTTKEIPPRLVKTCTVHIRVHGGFTPAEYIKFTRLGIDTFGSITAADAEFLGLVSV